MILRTVYNPKDYLPGTYSGIEYQTQAAGTVIYLDDVFSTESQANAAFPNVSGHWDPLGLGDTWSDWSVDSACIMEAFECAAQQSKYWEKGYAHGILEFDPGVYHVSMGHVWFYSAVQTRGLEHCRFDGCRKNSSIWASAGTSPSWWVPTTARAVLTIGHDSTHRNTLANTSGILGWYNITTNLPYICNYENIYTSGLANAKGAGLRILSYSNSTFNNVNASGPFKFGVIFCAESQGSAYGHFNLGYIHNCLVGLKWRHRAYMNDNYVYKGEFTHRFSGAIVTSGYNPLTNPSVELDADNSIENPNHEYETGFSTPGHWEFQQCGFESQMYNQFIRASGISYWWFRNIRWEAFDRPSFGPTPPAFGAGTSTYRRPEWFLKNISHCTIDGGSSQFMIYGIPSGVLGRGMNIANSTNAPIGYPSRNQVHGLGGNRQAMHYYGDMVFAGKTGGIVLDSYDGTRSYRLQTANTPFSSNGDVQVIAQPVPKISVSWRKAGTSDAFVQTPIYIPLGSGVQLKHGATHSDYIGCGIREQALDDNGRDGDILGLTTWNSDGTATSTLTPTSSGWWAVYGTSFKYLPGTSTENYDLGRSTIKYSMVIMVSGV